VFIAEVNSPTVIPDQTNAIAALLALAAAEVIFDPESILFTAVDTASDTNEVLNGESNPSDPNAPTNESYNNTPAPGVIP
jgi:hypothetical protein